MDILTVCQLCVDKGGDVDGYTDCIPVMCGEGECRWIY